MENRAKKIVYVVEHCQAGTGDLASMKKFWKSKGWKSPGYYAWVDFDGTINYLADINDITNGVAGFNAQSIHICYRGGIENVGTAKAPILKGKDTRTQAQKDSLLKLKLNILQWLEDNGQDMKKVMILGHYHFSDDQNNNGAIESWERIKECPCFDSYTENTYLMEKYNPLYKNLKLPSNR
jgi:N-acetylmuramoyl-L-alanine amidase